MRETGGEPAGDERPDPVLVAAGALAAVEGAEALDVACPLLSPGVDDVQGERRRHRTRTHDPGRNP